MTIDRMKMMMAKIHPSKLRNSADSMPIRRNRSDRMLASAISQQPSSDSLKCSSLSLLSYLKESMTPANTAASTPEAPMYSVMLKVPYASMMLSMTWYLRSCVTLTTLPISQPNSIPRPAPPIDTSRNSPRNVPMLKARLSASMPARVVKMTMLVPSLIRDSPSTTSAIFSLPTDFLMMETTETGSVGVRIAAMIRDSSSESGMNGPLSR